MTSTDALITDYRDRLRQATADLPAGRRAELLDDIDAHLAEVTGGTSDEATVRQALDELGPPEAIAEAARDRTGPAPAPRGSSDTLYDVAAVLVLMLGGFVVPVLGWIAGVVMLWNGPRWTTGEKWMGTLVWPVSTILPLLLWHARVGSGTGFAIPVAVGILMLLLILPTVLVYLLRVAARRRRTG